MLAPLENLIRATEAPVASSRHSIFSWIPASDFARHGIESVSISSSSRLGAPAGRFIFMPSQERPDCPVATYHDISRDVFWKAKNAPGLSAVSQVASGRLFLLGQAWIGPFKVQKVPYRRILQQGYALPEAG